MRLQLLQSYARGPSSAQETPASIIDLTYVARIQEVVQGRFLFATCCNDVTQRWRIGARCVVVRARGLFLRLSETRLPCEQCNSPS